MDTDGFHGNGADVAARGVRNALPTSEKGRRSVRTMLRIEPVPEIPPEIGRWLWALEEVRRRTLDTVAGLEQHQLDWEGDDGQENAIGSMLYHLALIEMDWLYEEVAQERPPATVVQNVPFHHRTKDGRLARVPGVSLDEHVDRLRRTRQVFVGAFRSMSIDDWRRPREPEGVDYAVTPAWVVFHLIEHEAGHGAQMAAMKARLMRGA